MSRRTTICLDELGGRHSWQTTGLDIVRGELVHTRRCVWCASSHVRTYGTSSGWRVAR